MVVWTVESMVTAPQEAGLSDVVKSVTWLASDTDGTNVARKGNTTEMPLPAGGTFVPYDQLTEAEVIGWVKSVLGDQEVAAIEADLNVQIVYMQQPPVVELPLPWA